VSVDSPSSLVFEIPEPIDIDGDAVTISVEGLEDWMTFDEEIRTISY
jgi:hypothetical protein